MITLGCPAHYSFPYRDEVRFARDNGFSLLQIWYDRDGISITGEGDPLEIIRESNFPAIIHAVLDVTEIMVHTKLLLEIVIQLGHREVIIHPVCKIEGATSDTIRKLSDAVGAAHQSFAEAGVGLFVENNSPLDSVLVTPEDIDFLFSHNPRVGFLLDVAHMDSYATLREIVQARFPGMLHIADKHLDVIHEHLPIGEGELDFPLIFSDYLKDFSGKAILEITQSKSALVNSRRLVESFLSGQG